MKNVALKLLMKNIALKLMMNVLKNDQITQFNHIHFLLFI